MPERQSRLNLVVRYAAIVAIAVVCVYAIRSFYCAAWWQPVTTVVVVRHAEKSSAAPDPPLSVAGEARAQTLAHVVEDAGVTAVFATEFIRTQQTVQPTADGEGLAVQMYAAGNAAGLADTIRSDHAGGVVLVAGHSNTVTTILEELGGDPVGLIAESDYDNLFTVTIRRCDDTRVVHLKYGDPT